VTLNFSQRHEVGQAIREDLEIPFSLACLSPSTAAALRSECPIPSVASAFVRTHPNHPILCYTGGCFEVDPLSVLPLPVVGADFLLKKNQKHEKLH
jgi:hypothetical protein